jgi:hypothetical protein
MKAIDESITCQEHIYFRFGTIAQQCPMDFYRVDFDRDNIRSVVDYQHSNHTLEQTYMTRMGQQIKLIVGQQLCRTR